MTRKTHSTNAQFAGFTIVELLIVIVVIAILAAITIVSYNGIAQQANNSSTISAAQQSMKLTQAYIAANGAYPPAPSYDFICFTIESGCATNTGSMSGNTTFETALRTIGSLPLVAPVQGPDRYGVMYQYHPSRTVDGVSRPAILVYYLTGQSQDCMLAHIVTTLDTVSTTSSNNYTTNIPSENKTLCLASVDGPPAS